MLQYFIYLHFKYCMYHEPRWWVHNRDCQCFFAKIQIEHTPKTCLKKYLPSKNNPVVVLCNEYRSTSKYQVKKKKYEQV